jgi:hypothetical protein
MAHMYVHHISITIHFLFPTLLPFSWAGWLSSTRSVRYTSEDDISFHFLKEEDHHLPNSAILDVEKMGDVFCVVEYF